MLDELSSLFSSSSLPLWLGRGAEDEDEPEDDAACCCSSHQSQSQPDRAETARMAARARDRIRFAFITVLLLEKPGPEKYTFTDRRKREFFAASGNPHLLQLRCFYAILNRLENQFGKVYFSELAFLFWAKPAGGGGICKVCIKTPPFFLHRQGILLYYYSS